MSTPTPQSPLYTPAETAEYLRANERTLERWRHVGGGPPFIKIGRRVVYRLSDLDSWVTQQRREHTSQNSAA